MDRLRYEHTQNMSITIKQNRNHLLQRHTRIYIKKIIILKTKKKQRKKKTKQDKKTAPKAANL